MPQTVLSVGVGFEGLEKAVQAATAAVQAYNGAMNYAEEPSTAPTTGRRLDGWRAASNPAAAFDAEEARSRLQELVRLGSEADRALAAATAATYSFNDSPCWAYTDAKASGPKPQPPSWAKSYQRKGALDLEGASLRLQGLVASMRAAAAACAAVMAFDDSMDYSEPKVQRRLAPYWRAGAAQPAEDLPEMHLRLQELSAKSNRAAAAPAAAAGLYDSNMAYSEAKALKFLAPYWRRGAVQPAEDLPEMHLRLQELCAKTQVQVAPAAARDAYEVSWGYSDVSCSAGSRLAPHWHKGYVSQAEDLAEMLLRLQELCARKVAPAAAVDAYEVSWGYSEGEAARRLAPYWSKCYISPAKDLEEMALRLEELCAKSAQEAAANAAAVHAYDDTWDYSESKAVRRLAPYWSKGYVSPTKDLEEMALRLEELCAKNTKAAAAASSAACWARQAFDDSHSYAELGMNKATNIKLCSPAVQPAADLEEMHLRLQELCAKHGIGLAQSQDLADMHIRLKELCAKCCRLAPHWRRGAVQPAADLEEMHLRLQELCAKHDIGLAQSQDLADMHIRLKELCAKCCRLAPHWRRGAVQPAEDLSEMYLRLQELCAKSNTGIVQAEALADMHIRLKELCAKHCRLAPFWRHGAVQPAEDLSEMHCRLAELCAGFA